MPKRRVVQATRAQGEIQFDLVSYGRPGPSAPAHLTPDQVAQVARTVRKVPEVMVKVSGGGRDLAAAQAHFEYIDRHGQLAIETDDGRVLEGKGAAAELVDDWNLGLSKGEYRAKPLAGEKDRRPKAVHNIVLSMPGSTPGSAVLAAAKVFARENFALQYRYAMVLHTDQRHPHVHLVVKAEHETESGKRLYIRKATLQEWRAQFAACLREQGVMANATPRALRGRTNTTKKDPIHQRLKHSRVIPAESDAATKVPKGSTFMRNKVAQVLKALQAGVPPGEPGKARMVKTRRQVVGEWLNTAAALRAQGEGILAGEVEAFVKALPAVRTENELIAERLKAQVAAVREQVNGASHRGRSR